MSNKDIDLQIESIETARVELKKHFGKYYELGALVHTIPLLEELKELREYKEKMEMQYLDDIDNPLEPLKLQSALQSEIFKYNYRKEHKPQDINVLDYTVMYALKKCLEEQLKECEPIE